MAPSRRSTTVRSSLSTIDDQLSALAVMAADPGLCALTASKVSAWSVGEQIEHLRRSDLTILDALAALASDEPRRGSPTLVGRLVLLTGFIPRGRGRAPSATRPLDVEIAGLASGLADIRRRFSSLDSEVEELALSRARIKHPALGSFDASQMIRFAAIHHHHHLKIINDIKRTSGLDRANAR